MPEPGLPSAKLIPEASNQPTNLNSKTPQKRKLSHSNSDIPSSPQLSQSQPSSQQATIPALFASAKRLRSTSPPNEPPTNVAMPPTTANASPTAMAAASGGGSNNYIDLTNAEGSSRPFNNVHGKVPMKRDVPAIFPAKNGVRKLVVKNLKQTPRAVPDEYVQKTWEMLDLALTAIFNETKISFSKEELYRGTENLCRAEKAPFVYENLRSRCEQYTSGPMKAALLEKTGRTDEEIVKIIDSAWEKWCRQLMVIRSIFFYLDRSYLLSSKLPSIWEMGLKLFSTHLVTISAIQPKLLHGIFALFERDRKLQLDPESASLLVSGIRMISSLNLYSTVFQPDFLSASRKYYSALADEESGTSNIAKYIAECGSQIDREIDRCDKFHLDSITKRELVAIIEDAMIREQMTILKDRDSIADLIDKKDYASLTTLYSLINRVDNVGEALAPAWQKYILDRGSQIVTDQERESEMVTRLLDLKTSLDCIWRESFRKNESLGHMLRKSFENFINEQRKGVSYQSNSKPAEMIAKYIDLLLRSGVKALTSVANSSATENHQEKPAAGGDEDAELATQLDNVLDLFRFIQGKDVFEAFYKKDLARRLLMGRSASADAERSMLSKLKTECGSGFTLNLEIMFKDIDLSKESITSFKNSKASQEKSHGVDLSVNILSQAAWPTYPDTTITLPAHLAQYLETYHEFYNSTHNGRKLMWRHALAHCVLKANFPKGKKELVVSAFQAVILLLFNDNSTPLSYQYIKEATSLTDRELARTLQSLACGKFRVLAKSPKGREVDKDDKFLVNMNFHDPKFRIKINQIQLKETKEETKQTHEQVHQDRQYETQAAIIRIMKSRKTVKHVDLVQQTIEQTKKRGMLDVADIKKNIERLIDKDYMERKEGNVYHYVA